MREIILNGLSKALATEGSTQDKSQEFHSFLKQLIIDGADRELILETLKELIHEVSNPGQEIEDELITQALYEIVGFASGHRRL